MEIRPLFILILSAGAVFGGTVGYVFIEGWKFIDGLYMTVITLSTVGFSEVHTLSHTGRVFTIFLIIAGLFVITYSITYILQIRSEGKFQEYMRRREKRMELEKIENHFIICGAGVTGTEVVGEFVKANEPFVIIEEKQTTLDFLFSHFPDALTIQGNAAREEVLREARIDQARGLMASVSTDEENVFIVITARFLNPGLRIVTRANLPESIEILKRAGADFVICPQEIGAHRLASAALRPRVNSFLDVILKSETLDLTLDEVEVSPEAEIVGKSLRELDLPSRVGLILVAIKPHDQDTFQFNPSASTVIHAHDTIIALGKFQEFCKLRDLGTGSCTLQ